MEIPGYTILEPLGEGGMASVFLAHEASFDRTVAIKVMASHLVKDSHYGERFLREARIVAKLSHPHIVPVYEVGVAGDHHFLVMEHLTGGDLTSRISKGLSTDEALQILCDIAGALDFAHAKGYVHRDIKPDNILFREDGSAVLTDFGIARPRETDVRITHTGTVVGTPKYMAPEQSQGKILDGRADLYSLGIAFYEMLVGTVPYTGKDAVAVALQHIREPVPRLPDHLVAFQALVDRLMAKDPDRRFQTGADIISAVDALREKLKGAGKPPATPPAAARSAHVATTEEHPEVCHNGLEVHRESQKRWWGLQRRESLVCEIGCESAGEFSIQFGRATTQMLEWHDAHGPHCESIVLKVSTRPAVESRVREAVAELCRTGAPFDFLDRVQLWVTITDRDGQVLADYDARD